MKKMMIALMTMLLMTATGKAMSYEQARNEALFLTDKMAYELNLTEDQYEAAYEINLDYLMGVTSYDDVYGTYWERRNLDLTYILLDWQLRAFRAATYFYRPLYWADGFWHFAIYGRYPHRDYFYYGRPAFYATYRGAHAWHVSGSSWYHSRRNHYIHHHTNTHFGMRDGWDRGDYRHHHNSGTRNSSTRTTVNNRNTSRSHDNGRNVGRGNSTNRPSNTTTTKENRPTRSLGGYRGGNNNSNNVRQIEKNATLTRSISTPRSNVTTNRNVSKETSVKSTTPIRSNISSKPVTRSTSSSTTVRSSSNSGSVSRGGSHSSGGSRSTGGGHHLGGRR